MTHCSPITARRPSTCPCGERIETGQTAYWLPAHRRAVCYACGPRLRSRERAQALDARDAAAAGHRTKPPDDP